MAEADEEAVGRRQLRVTFTESNLFHAIPEETSIFTRSTSMPRDSSTTHWQRAESCKPTSTLLSPRSPASSCKPTSTLLSPRSPASSWTASLDTSAIGRKIQNSFTLGFLFPDDCENSSDDELHKSLLDDDSRESDHDEEETCHIATSKSMPSFAAALLQDDSPTTPCKPEKHIFHRCETAPAMSTMTYKAQKSVEKLKRPEFEKGSAIVTQAGIGLMIYLAVGVAIYAWKSEEFSGIETFSVVDALYFCVVTMCTIGYGDIVPQTPFAKLFSCLFVLVGFGFIDALVSGMVTYVLDKQEHLLLSAVEGSHFRTAKKYFCNAKHGNRMRIRLKVAMALVLPMLCILTGTFVMMKFEGLEPLDAFYCTIMSVTTVGYGDHTFKTYSGRLFAGLWLLFSTLAVARCFLYLAEARVDKRHRLIAKWVLQRELTVGDLVQADMDHDGCISKAEFILYKLREMGSIQSHEIADISHQFEHLDVNNSGKISLARLQEGN